MGSYLPHGNNHTHRRFSLLHRHTRRESAPPKTSFAITVPDSFPTTTSAQATSNLRRITTNPPPETDLSWPFGQIEGLDRDEIRESAYEIFFSSCRSSPGFSGRQALASYGGGDGGGGGSAPSSPSSRLRGNGVGMVATSKIKRALGLKHQLMRMPSRRSSTGMVGSYEFTGGVVATGSPRGGSYGAAFTVPAKTMARRPLTSAEIMRMQMKVTEQSDSRLRKTLTRALAGQSRNNNNKQTARRPETIILPLELLRHLKPSEFNSTHEYNSWQRRQLHLLVAGLITYPSTPLLDQKKLRTSIKHLQDITRSSDVEPIDTSIHSHTMQSLCNSVITLAWRNTTTMTTTANDVDICHWVDGYPLNVNIYVTLLQAVFDPREETMMLDQVDELIELMKKTWPLLGISWAIHDVCFSWVLFNQYVVTGEVESRLLGAAVKVLDEVVNRQDRDEVYVKALASVLMSIIDWGEKRLMNYHEGFERGNVMVMENLVMLVLKARKMLDEDVAAIREQESIVSSGRGEEYNSSIDIGSSSVLDRVDLYIRSSIKNAFTKILEKEKFQGIAFESEEKAKETLNKLAQVTEELAVKEMEAYTNILIRWNPMAAGIAAVTLHNCYGAVLRQYLSAETMLSCDTVNILQRAGKLENLLVQMTVESSSLDDDDDNDNGGGNYKSILREMIPYEVDSIILRLFRKWVDDGLIKSKECVKRAKEIETWNPKSKAEPFAQSAVELMNFAKQIIDDFFQLPIAITDDLVLDLADGLESVILDYITFVASCGTKQSYLPSLPPLTRCNQDSTLSKLLRKASCGVGADQLSIYNYLKDDGGHYYNTHPSTSRGTQRLYIRLNTLHYLLTHLNSLDKTLSVSPNVIPTHNNSSLSHFNVAKASLQSTTHHIAEVAAYRLIFLDSHTLFCESLYASGVTNNSRIGPTVQVLKQNLALMTEVLLDRAQPLAAKEVMKAAFEAFLMVLLAGGSNRVFYRQDYEMIKEDFESLKRVFCTSGIGLIAEDEVEKEAGVAQEVIGLMGRTTEEVIEEFCGVVCEVGVMSGGVRKLSMPPTTGKWNREDPNTILRVLCHRDDQVANNFLKKTFQLPKRR